MGESKRRRKAKLNGSGSSGTSSGITPIPLIGYEPVKRNFRVLLEQYKRDNIPTPQEMCEALNIEAGSLVGAMDGMGERMMRTKQVTFQDFRALLEWGVALGYYFGKKQLSEDLIKAPDAPVIIQ